MVEVFCVCGEWSSKETFQWEFVVDKNTTASFINLEEDLQYEDLLKMISEDFCIQVEDITLSYEISLELKSTFEDVLPISIGNNRQLKSFICKTRVFEGICRLCIKMLFTRQKHEIKLMLKAYTLVESYQRLPIQRILMNFLVHLQIPKKAVEGLLQRGSNQLASLGFLVLNPRHSSAADVA
ncbi:hypothetical protein F2Q69_00048124 [Brassica cretica]|uniref:Uncharacterized protein n=1 Tax=Brassica cretica TaxID=69181 RepID=A0A8S9PQU9_BRACR|nr:hypothetical protein F2Q69_00048124 [Brassica cretica]